MAIELKTGPAPPARISYEEFLQWDGENQHVEWVNGRVVEMSPVGLDHNRVGKFLITLLEVFLEVHAIGVICYDPFQMKTGPSLPGRAPDIFFVSNENIGRLHNTYLEGPADLVVEIISPGSSAVDRRAKYSEYEKGGVREYWLIDPARKTAEFYVLDAEGVFRLVQPDGGIYRSAAIEGFWIETDWLWSRPGILAVMRAWGIL